MAKRRKKYSKQFKFQVVMELISKQKTQAEILSEYGIHPSQQTKWKKDLMERGPELFEDKRFKQSQEKDHQKQVDKLYRQIGQLSVERDWLQKKLVSSMTYSQRLKLIEKVEDVPVYPTSKIIVCIKIQHLLQARCER